MTERLIGSVGHNFLDLTIERSVLDPLQVKIVNDGDLREGKFDWADLEGVLVGTQLRIDADRIGAMPKCRAIIRYGIGVDNVDLDHARERDIPVCNVTAYCREEVALHALSMALSLMRGLPHWDEKVRAGVWRGRGRPNAKRPSQTTLGIVGLGQIGRMLAHQAANIFGRVVGYDPWIAAEDFSKFNSNIDRLESFDELVQVADVISVHVPLTPETQDLIGKHNLDRLRPGCILVNVSRGGIINEEALAIGLEDGRIGGAGIDTFVTEPIAADHPLLKAPRAILSPHMAWLSDAAEHDVRELAAEEMARILNGSPPLSRVA